MLLEDQFVDHLPESGRAPPPGRGPVPAPDLVAGDGVRQRRGAAAPDPGLPPDVAPEPGAVLPAHQGAVTGRGQLQQGELGDPGLELQRHFILTAPPW